MGKFIRRTLLLVIIVVVVACVMGNGSFTPDSMVTNLKSAWAKLLKMLQTGIDFVKQIMHQS